MSVVGANELTKEMKRKQRKSRRVLINVTEREVQHDALKLRM
jgi:hypothetical protein